VGDGCGAVAGLLDAGFEQVGGLEEEGGRAAGAEAGEEVEACFWRACISEVVLVGRRMSVRWI